MSGLWVQVDVDLPTHPRLLRLARLADVAPSDALGLLVRLWIETMRHGVKGFLRCEAYDIEMLSGWSGPDATEGRFVDALCQSGWLTQKGDGYLVHGWERYAEREQALERKKEANRDRQERRRKRESRVTNAPVTRDSRVTNAPVTRDSRVTNADTPPTVTGPETETETETELLEETTSPLVRSSAGADSGPAEMPGDGVLLYQCQGKVRSWWLTTAQLERWREQYPGLDVLAECRKAQAWLEASPDRRKTARGMPRMLTGWLGRAVDRGSGRSPPGQGGGGGRRLSRVEERLQRALGGGDDDGGPLRLQVVS